MRFRLPCLLVLAVLIGACFLGFRTHRNLAPAFPRTCAVAQGTFPRNGEYVGEPLAYGDAVRHWGSWAASDEHRGTLRFGPFRAPAELRFAVTGYPEVPGNEIYLERQDTHERFPIPVRNLHETWMVVDVSPPAPWLGQPVTLVAVDGSSAIAGWLGISEPLRQGLGEGNAALFLSLTCWLLNGALLGILWVAALRIVRRGRIVPPQWAPLVAAGAVAAAGYMVFWLFFAAPAVGKLGSVTLLAVGAILAARRSGASTEDDSKCEGRPVVVLLLAVGFFYLALLHLFPSSREFYDLAANRLREGMPGDNTLPHNVAAGMYVGADLRPEGAEWLTSDRPPLQSGWQLLTLPVSKTLGLDDRTSTGTSAVWLQLLWIPAAYGLLRTLGLSARRASGWIVLMALSGFFAQNTLFTWPKLSAAAFGSGAFALWFLCGPPTRTMYATGAALAGLAWLSHGGIAFSFLALLPWALWQLRPRRPQPVPWRAAWSGWLLAAAVFATFALPWLAFQKLYNPPGDRLIKMHLAGHNEKDPRGAWTVIREAYHNRPTAEIIRAKLANFEFQTLGDWPGILDFKATTAAKRRNNEFFSTGRALTWWIAGAVALPLALLWPATRRTLSAVRWQHAALAAWLALTVVIWCLLMFEQYSASIHQGSYAVMLVAFVLLSAWLDALGGWTLLVVAGLQTATFATTWGCSNPTIHGTPAGWPYLAAACVGLGVLLVRSLKRGPDHRR